MSEVLVQQALYGYERGHRLITSSVKVEGPSARTLRSVTDMKFDGWSSTYVTVLPLPDDQRQAFIRTWPAGPAVRAGGVWSHVLMVDFVDLGVLSHLRSLFDEFRQPTLEMEENLSLASGRYSTPLAIDLERARSDTETFDPDLVSRLVAAAYGSDRPGQLVVPDPSQVEGALLDLYEQQWPRLRRTFAFRTRRRSAPSTASRFDVEVVERRSRAAATSEPSPWLQPVVDDLLSPNEQVRGLLRTFGAESEDGRRDLPHLLKLFREIGSSSEPEVTITTLCRSFPSGSAMRGLKGALLGPLMALPSTIPGWTPDEGQRLQLLLESPPSALDFESLLVEERLVEAWTRHLPWVPQTVAAASTGPELSAAQLSVLADAVVRAAPANEVAEVIYRSPPLRTRVLPRRPEVVRQPLLWRGEELDHQDLLALIDEQGDEFRRATFVSLAQARALQAAAEVAQAHSSVFWSALDVIARESLRQAELLARAETFRQVLQLLGSDPGPWQSERATAQQLILLALVDQPAAGLWRQRPAIEWVELVANFPTPDGSVSENDWRVVHTHVAAIAFAAGTETGDATLRRRAVEATFALLHAGLSKSVHDDDWALLADVLDAGNDWDRCKRLRDRVVEEMVNNNWNDDDVRRITSDLGPFGDEMASRVHHIRDQRNRSWLDGLIDFFR